MTEQPLQKAGIALVWRVVQLGGVKLIFFVRLLILARLLTPDDFGLVAIAVATVGFFLSVTDVGMIPALVQGKMVEEKHYDAAWTVGVLRASGITVVLALFAAGIANLFAEPRATGIILALSIRPLLDALASIKIADLTRRLQFRPLAILKMMEAIISTVVAIGFAPAWGVWGLVAGVLSGSAVYTALSYVFAPHRARLVFDLTSARSLINFGQWIFVTSLIAMAGNYLLRVVISRQVGVAGLGLYSLATQLALLPSEVASEVVGSVAFPLFARLQSDLQEVRRAFRTMLVGMSAFLYPACILILVLAPSFVAHILGPKWEGTEALVQILSMATLIGIFGDAATPILQGVGRPQKVTLIELVQSTLLILFVLFFSRRWGVTGAAIAWLPTLVVSQGLSALFVSQVLKHPFAGLGKPTFALLLVSLAAGAVALISVTAWPGLPGLTIASLMAIAIIISGAYISERWFGLGFISELNLIYPKLASVLGYTPLKGQENPESLL